MENNYTAEILSFISTFLLFINEKTVGPFYCGTFLLELTLLFLEPQKDFGWTDL